MRRIPHWRRRLPAILAVSALGFANGRPALVDAARTADWDRLPALIAQGAEVNQAEGDGSTALLWAAYHDRLDAADRLLEAVADANRANDLGVTPLWAACQNGSAAMVRRLLEAGADPNAALQSGETPLMVAARVGSPAIAELLLARGADPNARATRGQSALMWAAAQQHPEVVRVLLAHGADLAARTESWSQMMAVPPHGYPDYNRLIPHGAMTALLFAVRAGDLASARLLVEAGADVNDADAWGVTAVTLAAHAGYGAIVEFLLAKGADPNRAEAGFSALHIAIMRRDERMLATLLEHGADPGAPLRVWTPTRRSSRDHHFVPALVGATPFWLAARFTQPGAMRLLAKHGAEPRVVHRSEWVIADGFQRRAELTTPVMAALGMGGGGAPWVPAPSEERERLTLETVRLAADLGVDLNAANTDGRTALDAAKSLGLHAVVELLTARGAQPGQASGP